MSSAPDDDSVREALRSVDDPEAGMNIVDLGLIYGIAVTPERVTVDLTMTTAACPMVDLIMDQACAAVTSVVPPGMQVEIDLVWDPPWTPDKMSGVAREFFGWKF